MLTGARAFPARAARAPARAGSIPRGRGPSPRGRGLPRVYLTRLSPGSAARKTGRGARCGGTEAWKAGPEAQPSVPRCCSLGRSSGPARARPRQESRDPRTVGAAPQTPCGVPRAAGTAARQRGTERYDEPAARRAGPCKTSFDERCGRRLCSPARTSCWKWWPGAPRFRTCSRRCARWSKRWRADGTAASCWSTAAAPGSSMRRRPPCRRTTTRRSMADPSPARADLAGWRHA